MPGKQHSIGFVGATPSPVPSPSIRQRTARASARAHVQPAVEAASAVSAVSTARQVTGADRVDFANFGDLIKYLRESYARRLGIDAPGRPTVEISAAKLVKSLNSHGYSMSNGAYSLLENGKSLPHDFLFFSDAFCESLAIGPHDKYRALLRQQYAYDLLARATSPGEASQMLAHGSDFLKTWQPPDDETDSVVSGELSRRPVAP